MEIILFTLVGIALYFAADWILIKIEIQQGKTLPYRGVIYFFIFLSLALFSFKLIQYLGSA